MIKDSLDKIYIFNLLRDDFENGEISETKYNRLFNLKEIPLRK